MKKPQFIAPKQSLQLKFFGMFLLVVVAMTSGLSITYYTLTKHEKHIEFQQQIRIAFDIILQELRRNTAAYTQKLADFAAETPILQLTTSQYMEDPSRIGSVEFLTSYLKSTLDNAQRFGESVSLDRLSIYGADGRLLACYDADETSLSKGGVYIKSVTGQDMFFPIDSLASFGWLLSDDLSEHERPLPEGIAPSLTFSLSEAASMDVFYEAGRFGFRMMTPIISREQTTGMLVGDMLYTQQTVDWYAALTNAEINLFVGSQWILGTLTAFPMVANTDEQAARCEEMMARPREIPVYSVAFDNQDYYQGRCVFDNAKGTVGTVTVSVSRQQEYQALSKLFVTVVVVTLIALIVSIALSALLSRSMVSAIRRIDDVVRIVAEGDLRNTAVAYSQDELGSLVMQVNRMIMDLRVIVSCVQGAERQVTSAADELAASIKSQGSSMIRQVESADYVVNAVEAISSVAGVLGDTMQQVSATAQETAEFANQGQENLERMEDVFQHIGHASSTISEKLAIISDKADSITSVVTTITSVADQTNLLSLNAAIEAEKAGDAGRGFAVVAREIRRLADQTAVATLDIEDMVKTMQVAVSEGVGEMDRFIAEVRQSTEDVSHIGMQLSRIIEQVQRLLPNFADISVVMGHQAENAQQIHEVIVDLSNQMQQTMESLHGAFDVITRLNDAAKGLQNEVSRFKV